MERNRPSRTAVLVARGVAAVAATPELSSLAVSAADMTRAILRRESAISRAFLFGLRLAPFRAMAFGISNAVTSGVFLHFALRKRWIEARVRAAIADGFSQVVVVGAGLDTLALRLAGEFRDVRFLEIDHPASQASKLALLPTSPDGVRFCALDLSLPGASFAQCDGFDPERATVFIAEGLTMYLPEEAVRGLFSLVRAAVPRARVVFSAMTVQADGRIGFRRSSGIVDAWLALRREPFLWGIRPEEVAGFLSSLGFRLLDHAEAGRFRSENARVVGERPVAEGEHVYVAEAVRE